MLNLFRRFADLRIRYQLLISYSAVFVHTLTIGSELKNTTQTILNMVKISAGVSTKNHLRAVTEKTGRSPSIFRGIVLND